MAASTLSAAVGLALAIQAVPGQAQTMKDMSSMPQVVKDNMARMQKAKLEKCYGINAVAKNDCAQGATLTVDLAAVAANTRFFASRTKAEVMAVVKADGFGHGCVETARMALDNGATWLGVTSIAEGLALRQLGSSQISLLK